ncbi:class I SAM-dependent methyltransferase [Micropruina sonneratiae]|uniref:class I SAM-dependent methyltransferase n=1 Tax=Micropruina sonneratiae TaxID=2986940 RepID=UPI002226ABF3|nr:methyltransferase domain-containing protein [Micropruina sp. KQZ13P-5]MCW3159303.1 methyltransferase domain-containing protein [Micropruina sp. KQZ13P-5]
MVAPVGCAVRAVRRHPGVLVRIGSAELLPFEDARIDATLSQLVLHFVTDPDAAAAELARVNRPGDVVAACVWDAEQGMGLLSDFWQAAAAAGGADHTALEYRFGTPGELTTWLTRAGFADVTETTIVTGAVTRPGSRAAIRLVRPPSRSTVWKASHSSPGSPPPSTPSTRSPSSPSDSSRPGTGNSSASGVVFAGLGDEARPRVQPQRACHPEDAAHHRGAGDAEHHRVRHQQPDRGGRHPAQGGDPTAHGGAPTRGVPGLLPGHGPVSRAVAQRWSSGR